MVVYVKFNYNWLWTSINNKVTTDTVAGWLGRLD